MCVKMILTTARPLLTTGPIYDIIGAHNDQLQSGRGNIDPNTYAFR